MRRIQCRTLRLPGGVTYVSWKKMTWRLAVSSGCALTPSLETIHYNAIFFSLRGKKTFLLNLFPLNMINIQQAQLVVVGVGGGEE